WGLVGWGLLRMHNWARWVAMLACVIGIAFAIPAISSAADIAGMIWPSGIGIILRAAVVWYLLQAPSVVIALSGNKLDKKRFRESTRIQGYSLVLV
ncbi:MAG TPA: hypothetical protein VI386_00965, partial [Candidatus Sulfotelmatobacter sp.]